MSRSMLQALAITWTIATVVEIAAAVLIIVGDGSGIGLTIAIVVFLFSVAQAVAYWVLLVRRSGSRTSPVANKEAR